MVDLPARSYTAAVETYGRSGQGVINLYTIDDKKHIVTIRPSGASSALQALIQVFLPAGYPATVTSDYLRYQIFDSLQAFASEIAGLLASRAVLTGLGVGSAEATATSAVLINIVQDTCGRIATILSAWKLGPIIEPDCKQWRLAADVFNDVGIILECLSPAFPFRVKIFVLCLSRISRALCGVAAGSAKAALSRHFVAPGGSIADINAKESSQETVVALCGMLVGSMLVPRITSTSATWVALVLLISIHIFLNWCGVRLVTMRSMNRQRATIVLNDLIERHSIPSPEEVRVRESIFTCGSTLWTRKNGKRICSGRCHVGVSLSQLIARLNHAGHALESLLQHYEQECYVLLRVRRHRHTEVLVCLKPTASHREILQAWAHALLTAGSTTPLKGTAVFSDMDALLRARTLINDNLELLAARGWNLNETCILTSSDRRIQVIRQNHTSP